MRSFSGIIDHLGIEATAKALGVTKKHVTVMKARDSIPAIYWDKILVSVEKAGVKDISFDRLRDFRRSRSGPDSKQAA